MDIQIDSSRDGMTIRSLLRGEMGFSSSLLKKLKFSEGGILVNGSFVTVRYELAEGDILSLALEDTDRDTSPYITPEPLALDIAMEDEYVTVIDKPSAMPAHPSLGHKNDTAANALAYRYAGSPYVFRPVNRLDRDTSGLMLTANSRLAACKLYSAMTGGRIKKVYAALLNGVPRQKSGIISAPITRCEDSIVRHRIAHDGEASKQSVSVYRVLCEKDGIALVIATPVTGRTHQLRLHFAHIGCPVLGDDMYGPASPLIARQALHSAGLVFPHPATGLNAFAVSPLPRDMREITGDIIADRLYKSIFAVLKGNSDEKN